MFIFSKDSIAESEIVVGDESLVDIAKDDEEEETEAQQASEVEGQVGETTAEGADEAQEQLTGKNFLKKIFFFQQWFFFFNMSLDQNE